MVRHSSVGYRLLVLVFVLEMAGVVQSEPIRPITLAKPTGGRSAPDPSKLVVDLVDDIRRAYQASAEEARLIQDLEDGELNQHSLIEAALLAAGSLTSDELPEHIALYRKLSRHLQDQARTISSDEQKIGMIFQYLHDQVFGRKYQASLFDVRQSLEDGDFNCLTATILLVAISQDCSVVVRPRWSPSHVRCWLSESVAEQETGTRESRMREARTQEAGTIHPAGWIIETTIPKWELAQHRAGSEHQQEMADERLLTHVQLIAKVFYNRGIEAMKGERYGEALASTWASIMADGADYQAQRNLRACINNWALAEARAEHSARARQLLEAGLQMDPHYYPFQRNLMYLKAD